MIAVRPWQLAVCVVVVVLVVVVIEVVRRSGR